MAVGAGGALIGGVNRLPPVGLIDFSVGATGEAGGAMVVALVVVLVVVVVVGVVVSGAFPPCPQAVSPPMAMIAPMLAVAAMRRANRPDLMRSPICFEN
jgi:lipopolysaccharide export LptBFGC system permease protein LptF